MSINKYKFQDAFYTLSNCIDHLKLLKETKKTGTSFIPLNINLTASEAIFSKRLPNLFEQYLEIIETMEENV